MKAAVLHSVNNINIDDVEKPSIKSGEVLMKVEAVRICGTDVHLYKGENIAPRFPLIMGHEAAGRVVEVGSEVTMIKPDTRIMMDPALSCGKCYFCEMGLANCCETGGQIGQHANGAYAEYVAVPEKLALEIPDSISYEEGSFLESLSSMIYGQSKVQIQPGSSVAILGLGFAGMMYIQLARLSGASPLIGITTSPWKAELAKSFGADIIINAKEEDVVARVRQLTPHGGPDVVIEAAGAPQTIRASLEIVRPAGKILQYGLGPTSVDNINTFIYYLKDVTVFGVRSAPKWAHETAMNLVASKTIKIGPLISYRLPLARLVDGLEALFNRAERVTAIVINSFA